MKIARLLIAKQPKIRECLELKWDVAVKGAMEKQMGMNEEAMKTRKTKGEREMTRG